MNIVIINTNCSNLLSVKITIKKLGYNAIISDDPNIICQADKLFLPGIGSAKSVMHQLEKKKLIQVIKSCTQPILGICLGMQLFGSKSEENNHIKTLNIIQTPVRYIKSHGLPVPHMGWNNITPLKKHFLCNGIQNKDYFYFAHSYVMELSVFSVAQTEYGELFSSIIEYKNYYGVQFHPEKSSNPGLQLIKNFLEK